MKPTLAEAWREISPYLDVVLDLEGAARAAWLADLATRRPEVAARLRIYMDELANLDRKNFLAGTASTELIGPQGVMFEREALRLFDRRLDS